MAKERNKLGNWFEYVSFQCLLLVVKITPFAWGSWIGKQLGVMAYRFLKSRRLLTEENIRVAKEQGFLPGVDERKLARSVWENMGLVGSEFLYYYARGFERLKKRVQFVGEENLRQVLAKNKGAILIMGHIGNWELLGMHLSSSGYGVSPLVKIQSNPLVDKLIQAKRKSAGMKVIARGGFLRPVLTAFKQNEIVPFLIDQATRRGLSLKMFGRIALLPPGAAEFALKTGTPVIFAYMVREEGRGFKLVISEEINMIKTGDYKVDLERNAAIMIDMIQNVIIQYPEQWLWMHKLWPTAIKI